MASLNRYAIRRLFQAIPALLVVIVLAFLLIQLSPGDPAWVLAGDNASPEYVEQVRQRYGFDRPLPEQLWLYIKTVASGDLGYSLTYHLPVAKLIADRIPASILLLLAGELLAAIVGTALGAFSAKSHPSALDSALSSITLSLYCMPTFWTGLILILVFSVWTKGFLPASGMYSVPRMHGLAYVFDVLKHMILPSITIFIYNMPTYFRLTRASVFEIMHEDFVTTARFIGINEREVFYRHCLRNAILPSVTMAGLGLGNLLGGALITETVFSWPGIGRLMYDAIFARDFPLAMGILIIGAMTVIVATLVTDIAYAFLDPRIRYSKS